MRARFEQGAIEAKRDGLNALARDTGGFPLFNSNDLSAGLQRVLDDNETYYVLAYEPEIPYRDGRFHKLEVRVAGRPELKVRTRKGYLAPAETGPRSRREARRVSGEGREGGAGRQDSQIRAGLGLALPLAASRRGRRTHRRGGGGPSPSSRAPRAADLNFTRVNDRHQPRSTWRRHLDSRTKASQASASESRSTSRRRLRAVLEQVLATQAGQAQPGFYQARMAVREEARRGSGGAA